MALKVTVRPAATATSTVDVSEQTKKEVEEVFATLVSKPGSEAHLAFGTPDELTKWMREARAYCKTRKAGALRIRQLPSANLPDNEVRVNITNDLEENGQRAGRRQTRA